MEDDLPACRCLNCTHFKRKTEDEENCSMNAIEAREGMCKRYPHTEIKDKNEWCGEWN